MQTSFGVRASRFNLLPKYGIAIAATLLLPVAGMAGNTKTTATKGTVKVQSKASKQLSNANKEKKFSLQNVSDAELMREMMRRMGSRRTALPPQYRRMPSVSQAIVPRCPSPSYSTPAIAMPMPAFADPDQAMQMFAQEMARMHQQMMMLLHQQAPPAFMAPASMGMRWSQQPTPGMADVKIYSVETKPDKVVVKLQLPSGADQSMLKAAIDNNILRITGKMERVTETKDAKHNVFMKSQSVENFQRALMLPADIIANKMTTKSSNGFFTVTIPRKSVKKGHNK